MKEDTMIKIVNIIREDNCSHNDVYSISITLLRAFIENSIRHGIEQYKDQLAPKIDDSEFKEHIMTVGSPTEIKTEEVVEKVEENITEELKENN